MSETMLIPPATSEPNQKRTPTVYFIDDSATMREVIKIAFRRENINVITCGDAHSAIAQFPQNRPDVVITDVIMPDQDGFSVCSEIKQHPDYSNIPVVLMSGVVNKTVADKAVAVHADELIRKPFQPQELILRVKSLLQPKGSETEEKSPANPGLSLNQLFAPTAAPQMPRPAPHAIHHAPQDSATPAGESAWPRALADAFVPRPPAPNSAPPQYAQTPHAQPPAPPFSHPAPAAGTPSTASSPDIKKLRAEIAFLDAQVKKLQAELQNERQYNQALESQIRNLTHDD
jgi:CheY-like chemotaxis protein